jgi:two-component system, NtrC family, response regulator AlgB
MRRLLESARRAGGSDATILLTGESGAGKRVLARQIHLWSPRRERPFLIVDCASVLQRDQEKSLASSIDPPRSGTRGKMGGLEATQGGTLFLASVDDLPLSRQAEFARFVHDRKITTAEGEKSVDVRVIAASRRDLAAAVQARQFLAELYYTLNIVSLSVPPLRERPADILPLAESMLSAAVQRNHRGFLSLSPEAKVAMSGYIWPGNIRELRNAMEAAAILCRADVITLENLPQAVSDYALRVHPPFSSRVSLDEVEREYILRVLSQNVTLAKAAAVLGINKTTLWRKRKRYNLDAAIKPKARENV